jgi:adenylate kinase
MTNTSDRAAWLKGPPAKCNVLPCAPSKTWRLILLGAPGVGKGTQAELLATFLGACHLSTGDIFRTAKSMPDCDRSPVMNDALGYMKRGELVPDSTILDLVRERLACLCCRGGFLLDGFPRTVNQAKALQELLESHHVPIDGVLDYQLPLDEIVARLSGRRTCPQCKAVYHVENRPPKKEGICDSCGAKILQREDDRPEAIRVRMHAYERSTAPLTEFYQKQGRLFTIPADGTPDQIFERTMRVLKVK